MKHISKSLHNGTQKNFRHAVRTVTTSVSDTIDEVADARKVIRPFEEIPGPKKYPIIGSILSKYVVIIFLVTSVVKLVLKRRIQFVCRY